MVRKVFFWAHLCAGAIAGIVILTMAVSGVLLTYERQMIAYADRAYRSTPPMANAERLKVETLLAKVHEARGAVPSAISLKADRTAPAELNVGKDVVYVDIYSGTVLGEGAQGIRNFFRTVTDWHRWLGAKTESRPTMRTVTGVANIIFLCLLLSGLYLWIPRVWKWHSVKAVAVFRGGLSGKARDFNWHNVIGLWMAVPLLLIIVSGAVISFPWATRLIYFVTGTEAPAPARPAPAGRGGEPSLTAINRNWAFAETHVTEWQTISLRLPMSDKAPLAFTIDGGHRGRPDKRVQLTLKRDSEQIVKQESFASFNTGRRVRGWLRFIHTGEAGGLAGQTLAGVASAGGTLLVWTGLALAWRRFWAWRSRSRQNAVSEEMLVRR